MSRLPFLGLLILSAVFIMACTSPSNHWNAYRPVYFKSSDDSLKFSNYLQEKGIASVTLEDISLEMANFPSPTLKTWSELEAMASEDPRQDNFIKGIPSLFKAGESSVVYVPKNTSPSTLQKYAGSAKVSLWFGPDELIGFKKMTYLVCFMLVGLFWIFLRKPQAFFSLFALILGLIFINISPETYYALVAIFFAYATLLDNWSRHYTQVRSQGNPVSKTIRHTVLSWLIFLGSYIAMATILKINYAGIFLLSLYFVLLLASVMIWIFWVRSRNDHKNFVSFFPSNMVSKNWNLYTAHGFFYLGALILGVLPFFILGMTPNPPQAPEYIESSVALYPDIDRTSLLILYRTPSEYPNIANYLAHCFYQQSLPLSYKKNSSFPADEETITQKVYDFDGIEFKEEKEKVLISLSDEWIATEIKNLPAFWQILISPEKKILVFKVATEPSFLFSHFEKQLIWLSLGFFLIFSLKLKSYFRIINAQQ